uniref:Putative transcriptional repressor n=1 Tax=viral metagenome TaxID=1070528 RepID=A0A6M3JNU4_9ZZZZ
MTPKQQLTLKFINQFNNKKGYMPSLKEIGEKFKLSSKSSQFMRVKMLWNNGYIIKQCFTPRGIKLTPKAKRYIKKYV